MKENIQLRDWAWEPIELKKDLLKKFKLSIFWIMWYKPGKNDAELVEFLSEYRKYQENILNNPVNNINYKQEKAA